VAGTFPEKVPATFSDVKDAKAVMEQANKVKTAARIGDHDTRSAPLMARVTEVPSLTQYTGSATVPPSPIISGVERARRTNVSTYTVQPGARMLWCLRRRSTDVRCILYPNEMPVEVQVLQDRDVVLTELFQEEWLALNWARAYCERLKLQGWHDSQPS